MVLKTSSLVSAWVMRVQKMFRLKRISLSLLLIVQNILTFTEILCKMDTQICLANYHLSNMFFLMFLCIYKPYLHFSMAKAMYASDFHSRLEAILLGKTEIIESNDKSCWTSCLLIIDETLKCFFRICFEDNVAHSDYSERNIRARLHRLSASINFNLNKPRESLLKTGLQS